MSAPVEAPVTIDRYLESSLTVGEPSSSGPLTVLSVFGSVPRQEYISLKAAIGQIGMIAVAGGEVSAFDLVSRPEVMADLHGALLQGYAFDALVAGESGAEVDAEAAGEFLARTLSARILERDGVGLGRDFRFESPDLVGAGLVTGEELVQLSAFPAAAESQTDAGQGTDAPRTRIRRPSRRRKR